ncbi:MAG TPA: glutamate--tRNA ligase [Bryobacterales bacterium]|nr:glutamate--tRNA ligase [Bryobacterales bacterium]
MVRVRFAPSPTGFLHIGGARTYIFNWLFARQKGGAMVLRIDDTDLERNTEASRQSIFEGLRWLGLDWDEEYAQSARAALHRQAAQALLDKGFAYRDFTPAAEAAEAGKDRSGAPWLFNPGQREISREESDRRAAAGERFVLRYRVPRERVSEIRFDDAVYGPQARSTGDIEDFALARSDGTPTYYLASCADDADLRISHIIRGQDHLANTFKHVLIFEGLGAERPELAHLPLLLAPDGSKLSKRRHGQVVSVTAYRDAGFLPHAFVNFLSLLGWSPKDNREVLSRRELIELFSLEGINRNNAVVSYQENDPENWPDPKALWLNAQHLRSMPIEELLPYVESELRRAGLWQESYAGGQREWFAKTVDLLRARYTTLRDFSRRGAAYFGDQFAIEPGAQEKLQAPGARELLRELGDRLEKIPDFTEENIERELRALAAERGVKAGVIINAARAALSGQSVGPSAFSVFTAVGRERAIKRLRNGVC